MEILKWTPEELNLSSMQFSKEHIEKQQQQAFQQSFDQPEEETSYKPDVWTTAKAEYEREHLTLNALRFMHNKYIDLNQVQDDETWNPYVEIQKQLDAGEWDEQKYAMAVDIGIFDSAVNKEHLNKMKQRVDEELELIKTVNSGSITGRLIGGLAAAVTDPITFVPFIGVGSKLGQLARSSSIINRSISGAAVGGISQSINEAGLQVTQDFRTAHESFMNIGIGTAFGAAAMGLLSRPGEIPTRVPNNEDPLNIHNDGINDVLIRDLDGNIDSIGAARAPTEPIEFEPGLIQSVPGARRVANWVTGATIAGRITQRTSGLARDIMTDMADMGGILTRTNKYGVRTGISSEDIKEDLLTYTHELFSVGHNKYRDLNRELSSGKLGEEEFWSATEKHLLEDINGQTLFKNSDYNDLVSRYGQNNADKIVSKTKGFAEDIHKHNTMYENELQNIGALRDDVTVKSIQDEISSLSQDISHRQDRLNTVTEQQQKQIIQEELNTLNEMKNNKIQSFKDELGKPASLGRQYGHAQLWNSNKIWNNLPEFKTFIKSHLEKNPENNWLIDNYGIHADDLLHIGKKAITNIHGHTISVADGITLKSRIYNKWRAGNLDFDQITDDIITEMTSMNRLPQQIFDRIAVTTGRAKGRKFHLSSIEREQAIQSGWLRTDLNAIMDTSSNQLSGFIGFHKGLMTKHKFKDWNKVLEKITEDYHKKISRTTDQKKIINLRKELTSVLEDTEALKNRLLGTTDLGANRSGWPYWLSKTARAANLNRFAGGFLISSLTDPAVFTLNNGASGLGKMLLNHGRESANMIWSQFKGKPLPETEYKRLLFSMEWGGQAAGLSRLNTLSETTENGHIFGIGTEGTWTNKITGNVDKANAYIGNKVFAASGMRVWNRFWKISTGLYKANYLFDVLPSYSGLSPLKKAKLSSLGIGEAEADMLHKLLQKHGTRDNQGHFDPNLEAWKNEPNGLEAVQIFRVAIERDMRRNPISLSAADSPILMDHAGGKLFLQFQSFAFSFLNKFMIPLSQRVSLTNGKDAAALSAMAVLGATSLSVSALKDIQNFRDPRERFQPENIGSTLRDMLDRSGMLTYLSPYIDSALKLGSSAQEALIGTSYIGPSSKFARNQWLESILGANFHLFTNIQSFGAEAAKLSNADKDKLLKKGEMLLPLSNFIRLLHHAID